MYPNLVAGSGYVANVEGDRGDGGDSTTTTKQCLRVIQSP